MEASKSQDQQDESASWRPKRADGLFAVWVERPENQECRSYRSCLKTSKLKAQEEPVSVWVCRRNADVPVEGNQTGRNSLIQKRVIIFVLFGPSTDWIRPTHIRESNLLYSVYYLNIILIRNSQRNTQKNIWPNSWTPLDPVKWTHKHPQCKDLIFSDLKTFSLYLAQGTYYTML